MRNKKNVLVARESGKNVLVHECEDKRKEKVEIIFLFCMFSDCYL